MSVVWGEWCLGGLRDSILLPTRLQVVQATSSSQLTYFKTQCPTQKSYTQTQHSFTMSAYNAYYYTLPMDAPKRSRSGSRRPALSPSTVSSPCITTHVPIASRRDSAGSAISSSGSPLKASALLAKVASSPPTSRGELSTPMASPETRMHASYPQERPTVWRSESDRYVHQYRQQGKHQLRLRL